VHARMITIKPSSTAPVFAATAHPTALQTRDTGVSRYGRVFEVDVGPTKGQRVYSCTPVTAGPDKTPHAVELVSMTPINSRSVILRYCMCTASLELALEENPLDSRSPHMASNRTATSSSLRRRWLVSRERGRGPRVRPWRKRSGSFHSAQYAETSAAISPLARSSSSAAARSAPAGTQTI
jgi:hypothetical protein